MATWCECTTPEFVTEAAGAVGLCKAPRESSAVNCVEDKPPTQATGRAQSYPQLSNRRTLMGRSDSCTRNGISTVRTTLEVATDKATVAHKNRHHRVEFLDFMTGFVADVSIGDSDPYCAGQPRNERIDQQWLPRHGRLV
jgi:hypothetical protein